MRNVILIGMPGSGKSTAGALLAKAIGFGFIDSDDAIRESEGKSLSRIIEEEGLDGFLAVEERVNARLCADGCVIATGGSVVYGPRAMENFKGMGTIVYLRLSYPEIEKRLSDLKARGVAIREGYTLRDLYDERTPLYERYADVVVDLDGLDMAGAVRALTEKLKI